MLSRDWKLPTNLPLCFYADLYHRTAQDSIFSQLTDITSPEQFEAAQANLLHMKQVLEESMAPFHFAQQFGGHICVAELYMEASLRLQNLALLQPDPSTTPEPEPLDPEEVFNTLEAMVNRAQMIPTLGRMQEQKTKEESNNEKGSKTARDLPPWHERRLWEIPPAWPGTCLARHPRRHPPRD
jgi:hypothetical protein